MSAPPGWYAAPEDRGGQRYWDGVGWTPHWVPPPPYYPNWGAPPWKGATLGRPPDGPGALANPGRRLAARVLDGLVLLGFFAVVLTVTLLIAAPHFGRMFPALDPDSSAKSVPTPGFVWLYLTIAACWVATGLVSVAYETVGTARYGRTFGKAWLHIRPVRLDGSTLGWGRAFGRASIYWLFHLFGWFGLLDPLWCLWDDQQQCLHDKVADSIVINDALPATRPS